MNKGLSRAVSWIWARRAPVLWSIGLVLAGTASLYLLAGWLLKSESGSTMTKIACVLVGASIVLVGTHFVHCFTRDLPKSGETLSRELRSIFVYAYVVQSTAILVALAPFIVPSDSLSSKDSWAGVVQGCLRSDGGGYGSQLTSCADGAADQQWLFQIGSRWLSSSVAVSDDEPAGREELSGGVVVPFYVVVLAIIGGAVGMTRRLPEIQRRAAHTVQKQEGGDGIPPIVAREMVVFQIMQVLAAPLIAVVAFAAFEPDTLTIAVLVGFVSGFASEAILKKLRQASEAVVGKGNSG